MPRIALAVILALDVFACVPPDTLDERDELDEESVLEAAVTVPPRGAANTLDIGGWNIEWFGTSGQGPSNEALQISNVRDVIRGADLDLWGVAEISNTAAFVELKSQLSGYDGFVANDPRVTGGSASYGNGEQKVGVVYKTSVITVRSSRIILASYDTAFAGRPPLEVEVTARINDVAMDFTIIVLHAKATGDAASFERRRDASIALKAYLDSSRPNDRVIVVGDFNDDLDVSISGGGRPSPYKNFVDDTAGYFWPSKVFTDTNTRTTVNGSQPIDHQLVTNELVPRYVTDSAEVYRLDSIIPSYAATTSDHFPTITRYTLGSSEPPPTGKLLLNEILANEPGSDTSGEFIELVNAGNGPADLAGWTLSDAVGVRHTFAAGTTLAAGAAIVVYGGASGIPAGVTAIAASSGGLALNNTTDTVTLRDAAGATVDSFAYPAALSGTDGVSMNRSPDASEAGAFVLHTALAPAASSPGRRANGGSF